MKKAILCLAFVMLLTISLLAELEESYYKPIHSFPFSIRPNEQSRNVPNVEFTTEPVPLMENYYDYFPGSYNRSPIVLQPEVSQPYGYPADGIYLTFQAKETYTSSRRVYYAYLNSIGELVQRATVSGYNIQEGFPAIAMDPITASPIIAYHRMSEDNTYDCYMTYDLYHLLGAPGTWKAPFIAIDNPEAGQPHTGAMDDQFIFPRIAISSSPNEEYSRCYILADNITTNSAGVSGYNPIIGYADFDDDLMNSQMELEFTYSTIPELDDLHYNNIARSYKDLVITEDGQVALVGWYDTTFFIAHSSDYGENFTYYETNGRFDLWNPQNQDGSYVFESTPFTYPSPDGKNFNVVYSEDTNKFLVFSTMSINTENAYEQGLYYSQFNYPKIYQFSIENGMLDVHVIDMQITGAYPSDGNPMVPWDLDENGIPDEFDENGNVVIPLAYTNQYYDSDPETFPEIGHFKLSTKDNWVTAIWQDTEKVYLYNQGEEGYEDWAEKPEILISVSNDYGLSWSQPAYLNAKEGDINYFSELAGMIPVYVYPAEELEIINDTSVKLHLFFTDDYTYGSSFIGQNDGSMLYYAAVNLEYDASATHVTVSGYVASHENPETGLEGALVKIENNSNTFQLLTDENGIFSFINVPTMSGYDITINFPELTTYTGTIWVGTSDYYAGTFILNEFTSPPVQVTASILESGSAEISWIMPTGEEWLHYDSGINNDALFAGLDCSVAIRYTPSQLEGYQSSFLKKVRFFIGPTDSEFYIRVWKGQNGDNLLVDQYVSNFTINSWNEVELDELLEIDTTQDLWIGYRSINQGGYPIGCDAGPAVAGYGDMFYHWAGWVSLYNNYGLNYNWNLQGLVVYSNEQSENEFLLPVHNRNEQSSHTEISKANYSSQNIHKFVEIDSSLNNRDVEQFVIYRLLDGEQTIPNNWLELSSLPANETSYIDDEFPELTTGLYRYAVKAVYSGNIFSQPAFSNILSIGMQSEVTVNVSTNSGDSAAGALVTLTHESNLPEYTYSMPISENETVIFPQVWKGIYSVDIHLAGFLPHHAQNIDFSNDFSFYNVQLIESLTPINNLEWSIDDNDVTLAWNEPSETIINAQPLRLQSESNAIKSNPIQENLSSLKKIKNPESSNDKHARTLLGYQVYRNGVLISDVFQETVFTDSDVPNGTYVYGIEAIYTSGSSEIITTDEIAVTGTDDVLNPEFSNFLYANVPNPFNPSTTIQFELAEAGETTLEIYNIKGQKVKTLANEFLPIGKHERIWNGKDYNNQPVSSGIYLYKLRAGKYSAYRKMILMK